MLKKIKLDIVIKIAFAFLFLLNSSYFSYHAVFTPFVPQLFNCRLIYVLLTVCFFVATAVIQKKIEWRKMLKNFVWILLPSAILILAGYVKYPDDFDRNSRLLANFVMVASSFLVFLKIFGYKKIEDFFAEFFVKKTVRSGEEKKRNNFWPVVIVFLVVGLNLVFGTYHLSKFAAVDEPLWTYDRIPKFWNNVLDGEWKKTMISDKPGITVAILSGAGLNWVNPKEFELVKKEGEVRFAVKDIEKMNFPMRFPILLFNALMLLLFYYFMSKLFNQFTALAGVIFIGLSPILLGISRIINPDSVFWVFSTLSILNYFLFIKNQEKKYLFFTGLFLGLSLLTKYVANFFFVFYFAMIFFHYIIGKKDETSWSQYFKKSLFSYGAILYVSLLIFFLFLPAAWVDFGRIGEGTIFSEAFLKFWQLFLVVIMAILAEIYFFQGKISSFVLDYLAKKRNAILKIVGGIFLASVIFALFNVIFGMQWIDFEKILASPKSAIFSSENILGIFLANFYPLIFGIHPVALLFVLVAGLGILFKLKKDDDSASWNIYLMLFIFFYYLACLLNGIGATVRYQIIAYPLIFIIASLGMNSFLVSTKKGAKIFVVAIISLFLLASLISIKPFYFSYASEILPKKYVLNLKDMGDGSYEAAEYLNSLPNAKNLIVWTDKRGVCYFFQGGCLDTFEMTKGMQIDYFVISASRQSRTERHIPYKGRHNDFEVEVDKIYTNENYEKKIEIGGRPNNFVKIFSYERLAGEK